MLEPPSQELVRQLTELQLCHSGDLRRASGRVRRLAYDLPAFDSVWIDSLVQLRILTPYQAKRLEEGHADHLRIGPLVIIDEMGSSHRSSTLMARRLKRMDRCVVKRQKVPPDQFEAVSRQLQNVLDRARGFAHPNIVLPNEIIPSTSNELITVSRLIPGLPLNELLVRRGRFPAAIVLEIGRQLLEGLAALHTRSLIHGDIRMSNVRLTDQGTAVLVDCATRPVIHPEITIHDTLSLEAYDGLAPELIGTGAAPSASSDLYALGCMLWQLLAGRPPFTTSDPLAKIAAHQTQTISDVRSLAPDTPPLVADLIRQMTSPTPQTRPRGFDEVLQRWGRAGSFGRSRLKQFRRLFNTAVPHFASPVAGGGTTKWLWAVVVLLAAASSLAMYFDHELRGDLLAIMQKVQVAAKTGHEDPLQEGENTKSSDKPAGSQQSPQKNKQLLPLPKPTADGVVLLKERGPYAAGDMTFAGLLTVRGSNGIIPEIVVADEPLSLTAQEIDLDHVNIRSQPGNHSAFLAKLHCQNLQMTNCEFVTNSQEVSGSNQGTMGLVWKPFGDAKAGTISVKNSAFHGPESAILLTQPPRHVQIENSLKTGSGPFLSLGPKSSIGDMKLSLTRVTLRESGPLLRLAGESTKKTGIAPFQIEANNCVFDLAEPHSGFIVLESDKPRADVGRSIEMKAAESFITPGCKLVVVTDSQQNSRHIEEADEQFEGLEVGLVHFSGKQLDRISDAKIANIKGPRMASNVDLPGIDPKQMGPSQRPTVSRQ